MIIIGYSFWGFLGEGIEDSPDGGRATRLPLIKALLEQGNILITSLQKDRDRIEGFGFNDLPNGFSYSDPKSFPDIDVLWLEYRWPIPGRNTNISPESINYTPDWDRQEELLNHYGRLGVPIIIWDKDQRLSSQMSRDLHQRFMGPVKILAPALLPPPYYDGSLLLPFSRELRQSALKVSSSLSHVRPKELVYIGNQYERDDSFSKYINEPSKILGYSADVYGNWTKYREKHFLNSINFPNVNFHSRVGYSKVMSIYQQSQATVLIAPQRYFNTGQLTQRAFEALGGGCIPLLPIEYRHVDKFFPKDLWVRDSQDVAKCIGWIKNMKTDQKKRLLVNILGYLKPYEVDKQGKNFYNIVLNLVNYTD